MDVRTTANITRHCVLPSMAATCAEQASCMNVADEATAFYRDTGFLPEIVPSIGDLKCGDSLYDNEPNTLTGGFAFDRDASELTAEDLFGRCMDDAGTLAQGPPTGSGLHLVSELFDVDAECVDVPRVVTALTLQGRSLVPGLVRSNPQAQAAGAAYSHRLMVRWLEMHAFIASETTQREKVADVFRQENGSDPAFPEPVDVLEKSIHGWDLLFDPLIANSIYQAPEAALVQPDYRVHRHNMTDLPPDEVTQALGPEIMEALAAQSELMHRFLEKRPQGMSFSDGEVNPVAMLMPRMLVAQTMAAELRKRADATGEDIPWADAMDSKADRARARFGEMASLIASYRSGANPLGIEDVDLPLYFVAEDADGAGARFAAVSDYIAGDGPGSSAWAPAAIAKAQASLSDARDAYIEESERKLRQARSDRDLERWVEDVRNESNATLRDYCGPLLESPVDDPNFDASTCSRNKTKPECGGDPSTWFARWTDADFMGQFCMNSTIQTFSVDGSYGFYSEDTKAFAEQCYTEQVLEQDDVVSVGECASNANSVCLRCEWKDGVQELVLDDKDFKLSVPPVASQNPDVWTAWKSDCQLQHPTMRLSVPRPDEWVEIPGCVRGAIGEAHLDVVDAAANVDAARQAITEYKDAYDIAMDSCFILQGASEQVAAARAKHLETMGTLRTAKTIAEGAAAVAGATKDCASTMVDSDQTTPWGAIADGFGTAVTCGAAAAEAVASTAAAGLGAEMEAAQASHEAAVAGLESQAEVNICFNDAKQELVGLKSATMDLEGAVFALERANARVQEQIADAQREWEDGHNYLRNIEEQELPDPAGDRWANERVNRYLRDMKLARRATFLAVRAVEYEYQQSMGARQDVLDAKTPVDLESVLQTLWSTAGTRTINGSRPTELTEVVSLRDDILRLGDRSDWSEEARPVSVEQRFRMLIASERYARYDESGAYIGQRIPFTLAPLEAFDFERSGVALYAATDCAERLWSVNAGIVGADVYAGSDTTNVRLDLLKRNTFFSQRCTEPSPGEDQFQHASVRPTRNLFREPGVGAPDGTSPESSGVEAFSRARMQAFLQMDRATLEDSQYANGATSELAARGLYGDYAIFIPAGSISRTGNEGLVLDRVDDILLRVDYLSVARP
jgi:hypothetical protein